MVVPYPNQNVFPREETLELPKGMTSRQSETISLPASDTLAQEIIRWQLDTTKHLLDIENRLQGNERRWNVALKNFEYVKVREPFMNDLGVGRVMGIVRTVIDPNTILSSYTADQANISIIDVVGTCIDTLYMNRKDFAVKKADLNMVRAIIENGIKSTFFRSIDGTTLEYLRGSHRTISTTQLQEQQRGILGRLGGMFKWG